MQNLINQKEQELQTLKFQINSKDQEIQKLKFQLNENSKQINKSDKKWGFAIKFKSIDQKIDHAIVGNEQDTISSLEQELYNEYPEYKDYNTFLTSNGHPLKRFKTVGENNIKKGDTILVNVIEENNL